MLSALQPYVFAPPCHWRYGLLQPRPLPFRGATHAGGGGASEQALTPLGFVQAAGRGWHAASNCDVQASERVCQPMSARSDYAQARA
jgi:hypothetical protein